MILKILIYYNCLLNYHGYCKYHNIKQIGCNNTANTISHLHIKYPNGTLKIMLYIEHKIWVSIGYCSTILVALKCIGDCSTRVTGHKLTALLEYLIVLLEYINTVFTLARQHSSVRYSTVQKCSVFTMCDLAWKIAWLWKRMWHINIIIISVLSKDGSNVSFVVLLEIFCCEKSDNAQLRNLVALLAVHTPYHHPIEQHFWFSSSIV